MYAHMETSLLSLCLCQAVQKSIFNNIYIHIFVKSSLIMHISKFINEQKNAVFIYVYIIKYLCTCVIPRLINTILNVSTCTHTHSHTHPQRPTTTHSSSPIALDTATLTPICCYCCLLFIFCMRKKQFKCK